MVAQEILRRDPEAKINPKNKSLAKLADELRSRNLTDAADVKFIRECQLAFGILLKPSF